MHSFTLRKNSKAGLSLQLCCPCASLQLCLSRMCLSKVSMCCFALITINKAAGTRKPFPKTPIKKKKLNPGKKDLTDIDNFYSKNAAAQC